MNAPDHKNPPFREGSREFVRTIFSSEFWRGVRRDFHEIYEFYIDEQTRQQFSRMGIVRRSLKITLRMLSALYSRLTPVRQALLVLAIILFIIPRTGWSENGNSVEFSWSPVGFMLLLFILLLELKDKLLAKNELKAGHSVQEALMPREMPALDGWEIWLSTTPANDVGGDLVDYLNISSSEMDLTLADVAGKGLGAALMAAKVQATLRAIAPECSTLTEMADKVNTILCRDGVPSRFVTLAYARLSSGAPTARILNAGHLPPLILRANSIEHLPSVAPAIGLLDQAHFVEQETTLSSGDYLIFVSDGVLEARSDQDAFFGEDRLHRLLERFRGHGAESLGKEILRNVRDFTGLAPRSDDISLVIARKIQ
jgi:hypothetical protein